MALQPKPVRERLEGRILGLRESAGVARNRAAFYAAIVAVESLGAAYAIKAETPGFVIAAGVVGALSVYASVFNGLDAVNNGNRAAVLEGALAQHELNSGMPFDESQGSYFLLPEKP